MYYSKCRTLNRIRMVCEYHISQFGYCAEICPNSSISTENMNVTRGERDVYTEGQNVTYGCREGWFNNGSQLVQTCQSDGTWSNQTEEFTECQSMFLLFCFLEGGVGGGGGVRMSGVWWQRGGVKIGWWAERELFSSFAISSFVFL